MYTPVKGTYVPDLMVSKYITIIISMPAHSNRMAAVNYPLYQLAVSQQLRDTSVVTTYSKIT